MLTTVTVILSPNAFFLTRAPEGAYECMKAAYDCGINFFDCAEGYAAGESEKTMGEAIKKFGYSPLCLCYRLRVDAKPV